jgi:small-conductance mechanosensitive channel
MSRSFIVPNSALVSAEVITHSRPTTNLRIRIAVGVAYGTDTERVKSTLLEVAKSESRVLTDPSPPPGGVQRDLRLRS